MRINQRLLAFIGAAAAASAAVVLAAVPIAGQSAAKAPAKAASLRTPWGDPDLQGIWHEDLETPLQRDRKYGDREFLTDEEGKAADSAKAASLTRDRRKQAGTEADGAGAYNAVFHTVRSTSRRPSEVVDPPDGRVPPLTAEA